MLLCNNEPDLILLTEVIPKAQRLPLAPALLQIPGYSMFHNFLPSTLNLGSSGTRGICLYAAEHLNVTEVFFNQSVIENVWVTLSLQGGNSLLIGCLYRSPSGSTEDSVQQLEQLIRQVCATSHSHLVVVGDFNLPQINWSAQSSQAPMSHCSHSFIETIRDCFLFQHVLKPTRYRLDETPSVLDLIFSREEGMVRKLEYLPGLGNSDHVVLQFTVACSPLEAVPQPSCQIALTLNCYLRPRVPLTGHRWVTWT